MNHTPPPDQPSLIEELVTEQLYPGLRRPISNRQLDRIDQARRTYVAVRLGYLDDLEVVAGLRPGQLRPARRRLEREGVVISDVTDNVDEVAAFVAERRASLTGAPAPTGQEEGV